MPETTTRLRGAAVLSDEARRLRTLRRKITAGEDAANERAAVMARLHDQDGYSYDAIAAAAGITREGVRKSINRWKQRSA